MICTTPAPDVEDLFAGPGGWDEALRLLRYGGRVRGWDYSADACATARAAGHERELVDLADLEPQGEPGSVDGVIGSPTCRPWSGANTSAVRGLADPRGALIEVPLRWVLHLRPRWTAWEITPRALAQFERLAVPLRDAGYSVVTGLVRAEQFGVPSTRTRAILVGRLDGVATLPTPTHLRAVTMAEALGWDGAELVSNYGTGGDPRNRGRRPMGRPAFTVTGKACRNKWEWPDGTTRNLTMPEASTLQGFRPDYPWQGGSTSQQQQVGDAVPPPLAAAILAPLVGAAAERIAA